jgi:nucleotide-binding universal stress UspA family protein
MVTSNIYLVPLDFSRGSERALTYALALARERKAKLVALHVVPAELIYPPTGGRFDFTHYWSATPGKTSENWQSAKGSSRRIVNSLSLAGRTSLRLSPDRPRKCAPP